MDDGISGNFFWGGVSILLLKKSRGVEMTGEEYNLLDLAALFKPVPKEHLGLLG